MSKEIAALIKDLTLDDIDKAKDFFISLDTFFDQYNLDNSEEVGLSKKDVEKYETIITGVDDTIIIAAMYIKYCTQHKEV